MPQTSGRLRTGSEAVAASDMARAIVSRKIRPAHQKSLDSLTADAQRVTKGNATDMRRLTMPWQAKALNYYDLIPEIHFASGFYARGLAGLRLYVGETTDEGEVIPSENPEAMDLLARVQDGDGGREQLLSAYGRLAFVTGECYLLWTSGEDGAEKWEIVSPDELRIADDDRYVRISSPALTPEELIAAPDEAFEPLPGTCVAYRLWTPHPRFTMWADSPMRACLDLCEELVLLTLVVRARVLSRLSGNGILTMPNELSPTTDAPNEDAPGEEDILADPFMRDLTETTVAPIEDPGSASAMVPIILRGPAEFLGPEYVRHISLKDVDEEYRETGLRDECIRRIATGLDMPPEALLGVGGTNHWNAWIIDEQTWKVHLKPVATAFCGNLTEAYLRPTAIAQGVEGADRLVVMFDEAAIVTNPDRGKDATLAYDRRAIGKSSLRLALGFSDDDAPTPEDLEEMLLVDGIRPETADADAEADTEADDAEREPTTGEETPREEPDEDESQIASAALDDRLADRLIGAAEIAVLRSREVAGSRLLARLQGGEANPALKSAPKHRVCFMAGPGNGDAEDLVKGGASLFRTTAKTVGLSDTLAAALANLIELHAARTLYEENPPPLPSGFKAALRR